MKIRKPIQIKLFLVPLLVAFFNILIIFYPKDIIDAAKEGVNLWFNNVFPSLLPFIIGTNLLTGLGAINFIGALLEPVMQPMFGVPGCGGFALITGMTSGYPIGAKITANLRETEQVSKTEAQRLLSFANNSGPLFILGAVGIGMFQSEKAGYFLMLVHYTAAIFNGLIFKYIGSNKSSIQYQHNHNLLPRAVKSMQDARSRDGRSFGKLLGDSVAQAMESILQIGGFIILFCVLVKALEICNAIEYIGFLLSGILNQFQVSSEVFKGSLYGIMEVTNGAKQIASPDFTRQQLIAVAVLISFGGFSIHAQSINFLSKTDISAGLYILSKAMHAGITYVIATLAYPLFNFSANNTAETFTASTMALQTGGLSIFYYSSMALILSTLAITMTAIFISTALRIRRKRYPS